MVRCWRGRSEPSVSPSRPWDLDHPRGFYFIPTRSYQFLHVMSMGSMVFFSIVTRSHLLKHAILRQAKRGPTMENDRLFTVPEVAERLRVKHETVRRWLREGRLRGIRLGGTKL